MATHNLIELDQSEASIVRRRLQHWSEFEEQAIKPLIQNLSGIRITKPQYVTNVYPLYYWAYDKVKVGGRRVYTYVQGLLPELFPTSSVSLSEDDSYPHLRRIVDSEIDVLVEDRDYFLFIEAKTPTAGQRIRYQDSGGVRQLVRQYIQGRILEKLVGKHFVLGAIGANNGRPIEIKPKPIEQALLRLVNDDGKLSTITDLVWPSTTVGAQSAG
jgi:hypothetical protein